MKIGIIGAMDVEVALLKEQMELASATRVAGMDFCEGTLGGVAVVVVRSGIGKVNAGICAQILADRFGVTHVINTGVAGSLDPTIDIGDVVVSTTCRYYDVDATVFGYEPGEVPQMGVAEFPADASLRKAALEAVAAVAPEIRAFEGKVVSGDRFLTTDALREELASVYGGRCAEMEGTAIAHACWLNGLPFVIVRAISDKPGTTTTMEYNEFEGIAARHCAKIVSYLVGSLAA